MGVRLKTSFRQSCRVNGNTGHGWTVISICEIRTFFNTLKSGSQSEVWGPQRSLIYSFS